MKISVKMIGVEQRYEPYQRVESVSIPLSGIETEMLEVRHLHDSNEVCVIIHGMGLPDEGECIYSILLDGDPDLPGRRPPVRAA